MAVPKFTHQQIEKFNDRIQNCLEDARCRQVFGQFLRSSRKPVLLKTLDLWTAANSTSSFDEDMFLDLIDNIGGLFNENPLLTIAECDHKLSYVKLECCRILEKIHPFFLEYLNKHHKL